MTTKKQILFPKEIQGEFDFQTIPITEEKFMGKPRVKAVEKPKPITAEDFLEQAAEVKRQKSKDYQGGRWEEDDYFPYGQLSFNHMLLTKVQRIMSVSEQEEVNFESLEDSLLDLINYAAMNLAYNARHNAAKE